MAATAAVAALVGWLVLRARHRRRIEARGWTFDPHPGLDAVWGLNCPPFGLGTGRRVADLVTGATPGGVPFTLLRYDTDGARWADVGVVPCGRPLPEAHLARTGAERPGIVGRAVQVAGWTAVAPDADWAAEVAGRLGPPLDALAAGLPEASVSLDGDRLTLVPFPRDPDAVAALLPAVEALARAAGTLTAPPPPIPPELSVYRHPDWVYRGADDAALDLVAHTGGGFDHEASDVYYAGTRALSLVALTHTWKTRETRTVPDGRGGTRTETYTQSHSEPLVEVRLGFPFVDLTVNWGLLGLGDGRRLHFESEDFNRAFRVRCHDERFAYDVIHPQTMTWLLARGARPFAIEGGRMRFDVAEADVPAVEDCLDLAAGFFGRVRRYTWQNLGLAEPPVPAAGPAGHEG